MKVRDYGYLDEDSRIVYADDLKTKNDKNASSAANVYLRSAIGNSSSKAWPVIQSGMVIGFGMRAFLPVCAIY